MPALLTSPSTRPKTVSVAARAACTSALLETSQRW
jgi:hypothetical protein